jgi:uncharacterized membrane protein YgcG
MVSRSIQFVSKHWIAIALTFLVFATFYNSWDLERTNDELVKESHIERANASAERRELLERMESLQGDYDQLESAYYALVKTDQQHLANQKKLLDWLAARRIQVPSEFIADANATPKYIHPDRDSDDDGREDDGGSGKAQGRDSSGKGNSGNGSNNGGGNNSGGGSNDDDDDGPGKSEDSHKGGNDKDKGKGNDKNKDKGKGKDK